MASDGRVRAAQERNFAGPDRWELDVHERALLPKLAESWPQLRVLDLGVGTGRTWFAFGHLAGRYLGVEIVPELARRARDRSANRAAIVIADAACLPLANHSFDLICFSFNGLDYADPPTRSRILREVARVARPGGEFYFTTHSLEWLRRQREEADGLSDVERQRLASLAPDADGIAVLFDDAGHGTCYVTHAWALDELGSAGFTVSDVHDDDLSSRAYLCQAAQVPTRPSY